VSSKPGAGQSSDFVQKEFFNHYRIEVQEAFDILGTVTYGGVASVVEFEDENDVERIPFGILVATTNADNEQGLTQIVARVSETITKTGRADLNLLKALLRRCRILNSKAFVPLLNTNFEVFLPVYHDLMKTMRQLYAQGDKGTVIDFLIRVYGSEIIKLKFIRYWTDWLASQDQTLLSASNAAPLIRASGDRRHQANAAVVTNDQAWIRGFRSNLDQLGDWDRRAVIGACRILGRDERRSLLSNVQKRFDNNVVDKLLVNYVVSL
jgi:hypothetical protein